MGRISNLRVRMKFLCPIRFVSFVEIVRVLTIIEWLAVNINNCLLWEWIYYKRNKIIYSLLF